MAVTVEQADSGVTSESVMTVAGVCLVSNLLRKADCPPSFEPFWGASQPSDLTCVIRCHGADAVLIACPPMPSKPWSFEVQDESLQIFRRNRDGDTLWRITGSLRFEQTEFCWNPELFSQYYVNYQRCWIRSLGRLMLSWRLRDAGGLLFHGMAADIEGQGILCVGPSGRGKSTLARLLDAAGGKILSDENPVVRLLPGRQIDTPASFRVYGTPWHSSGGFALNESVPLRRIYFIEHGAENQITPLTPGQALSRLIDVALVPWQNPKLFDPALKTIETLLTTIPTARFAFLPDATAVDALRRSLNDAATEVCR